MTNKAWKVSMNQSRALSLYPVAADEGRRMLKVRALMLDYEDLAKDVEAKKARLREARKNKQNLSAQVKFLRRKYKYLMQIQPQNTNNSHRPNLASQTGTSVIRIPLHSQKTSIACEVRPQLPFTTPELAHKANGHLTQDRVVSTATPSFDLNVTDFSMLGQYQYQRTSPPFASQSIDIPVKEKSHRGKETATTSRSAVLDLNQAAMPAGDEAYYHSAWEAPEWEQPAKHYAMEADSAVADLKLAACRNMSKSTSRNGKRKISVQDQLVLRV